VRLRCLDRCAPGVVVAQESFDIAVAGEDKLFDRAISAHARHAAKQRITCHLARNRTGIALENEAAARHFAKILGVGQPAFEDAQI
jgi:hypothetical protein